MRPDPPEHSLLYIHGLEQTRVRGEGFRFAEQEISAFVEREMESTDDLRLRRRVEVHESVSTDEYVYPRDRSVSNQIVAAEDHGATHVLPENELGAVSLEVAL